MSAALQRDFWTRSQEKVQASQSTVSHYLNMMQKAGLLESVRYGQWTYYRRNEDTLQRLAEYLK